jgi:hypothetical protein
VLSSWNIGTGSPTIFKPFGATTKASPGHVEKNSETAVDASANTSMQYVAVNANKILLRSQI